MAISVIGGSSSSSSGVVAFWVYNATASTLKKANVNLEAGYYMVTLYGTSVTASPSAATISFSGGESVTVADGDTGSTANAFFGFVNLPNGATSVQGIFVGNLKVEKVGTALTAQTGSIVNYGSSQNVTVPAGATIYGLGGGGGGNWEYGGGSGYWGSGTLAAGTYYLTIANGGGGGGTGGTTTIGSLSFAGGSPASGGSGGGRAGGPGENGGTGGSNGSNGSSTSRGAGGSGSGVSMPGVWTPAAGGSGGDRDANGNWTAGGGGGSAIGQGGKGGHYGNMGNINPTGGGTGAGGGGGAGPQNQGLGSGGAGYCSLIVWS